MITQVIASNIGGTATLIGDPPNILIGSATGLDFVAFLVNLGPVVVVILPLMLGGFWLLYRRDGRLGVPTAEARKVLSDRGRAHAHWGCTSSATVTGRPGVDDPGLSLPQRDAPRSGDGGDVWRRLAVVARPA